MTRIALASLDPASALARRISDALRRDAAEAAQRLASTPDDSATGLNLTSGVNSKATGGIGDQNTKRLPTNLPTLEIVLHLEDEARQRQAETMNDPIPF